MAGINLDKPGHDEFSGSPSRSDRLMCRSKQYWRLLAEGGGGFSGEGRQYQRDHMVEALVLGLLLQEVAAENHAQGGAVRQIEKAQGRDRNVELHRIDGHREVAFFDAAPHHRADHLDERRMHRLDLVERLRWRARARFSVLSSARNSGLRMK